MKTMQYGKLGMADAQTGVQPSSTTNRLCGVANSANARRLSPRVLELIKERDGLLPVWVRAPVRGPEHYSGFSRSKLYELAGDRKIRSVSIREPGQVKGTRLFNLASILSFIDECEQAADTPDADEALQATNGLN